MPLHDDEPLEDLLACSRDRAQQFNIWLDQLRAGDPAFAEASPLYPDDMGEWQAAVYLLTGCDQNVDRWAAKFPHVFETFYFRRWITACHLYKRITPAIPSDTGGER